VTAIRGKLKPEIFVLPGRGLSQRSRPSSFTAIHFLIER